MWVSSSGTVREEEDVVDNFKEVQGMIIEFAYLILDKLPQGLPPMIYPKLNWFDCHLCLPNILAYKLIPKKAKELQRQVMELLEKGYI